MYTRRTVRLSRLEKTCNSLLAFSKYIQCCSCFRKRQYVFSFCPRRAVYIFLSFTRRKQLIPFLPENYNLRSILKDREQSVFDYMKISIVASTTEAHLSTADGQIGVRVVVLIRCSLSEPTTAICSSSLQVMGIRSVAA